MKLATPKKESLIVLNRLREDFNRVLNFLTKSTKDAIRESGRDKMKVSKVRLLSERALSANPKFIVESALDHFLLFYKREDFSIETDVNHKDNGFSLTSGFRYDSKRHSLFLEPEPNLHFNLPVIKDYPYREEIIRIRFLNEREEWFIQIEYYEVEQEIKISEAASVEEWLKVSNELELPKTTERFYRPELSKMTTTVCDIKETPEVINFLERATKVSNANFNILVSLLIRSYGLNNLKFFRENEVLKLFTKLKELEVIREYEIPDLVARGVCREVSTHINYELKGNTKRFMNKDVENTNFFIVTSNRMFIDKKFKRIVFLGRISLGLVSTEGLEDTTEGIAVFFKEEGKWKVQISQHNEESREHYKANKEKWKRIYKNKVKIN